MIIVLTVLILILITIIIYINYEGKCRVNQWKGRYLQMKQERDVAISKSDRLEYDIECIKESREEIAEKYKKLQMKNCEKDIENQKKGK